MLVLVDINAKLLVDDVTYDDVIYSTETTRCDIIHQTLSRFHVLGGAGLRDHFKEASLYMHASIIRKWNIQHP